MKLPLSIEELEEFNEWINHDCFKMLTEKIIPVYDKILVEKLATTPIDEKQLLISRAKIDGAREIARNIKELKVTLKKGKE